MEIQVKVVKVLDAQRFTSSKNGNEYVRNVFVGETSGQYPKKIAFSVMGQDRFAQMGIVVGGQYSVSFDVESREWKEKWFTECSAWKAVCLDSQQPQSQVNTSATQGNTSPIPPLAQENANNGGGGEQEKDDLPF